MNREYSFNVGDIVEVIEVHCSDVMHDIGDVLGQVGVIRSLEGLAPIELSGSHTIYGVEFYIDNFNLDECEKAKNCTYMYGYQLKLYTVEG